MTDLTHSPPVATSSGLLATTRKATARHAALVAFVVGTVGFLIGTMSQAPKLFYYDSGVYWGLGTTFSFHGHFSLLNFNSPLRGYLLPLVDRGLHGIAALLTLNDSTPAKVFNCLIFALIATVLLPALAQTVWPTQRWGVARRLVLAAVLGILWGGYLAFPLSDFPAAAAALLALIAVARPDRVTPMLVAGIACGAAIDMRPAYILLPLAMLLLLARSWWQDRRGARRGVLVRRAACLLAALFGFALVTTPQVLATHHHGGGWAFIPGSQAHLSNLQYSEGMHLQLYDTYVGVGEPAAQMSYVDPTGTRLLQRNGTYIHSTAQYAKLILHHPLTMLGIFARHVINGVDQRYNTPYVEHVPPEQPLRLLSFAFVFFALVRLCWGAARDSLGPARWRYIAAVLISDATAVASAMEPRFMVLPACMTYITVLAPGWSRITHEKLPTSRRIILAVSLIGAGVVFGLIVHTVTTGAGQHLIFGP
jgi:hypothetical protein